MMRDYLRVEEDAAWRLVRVIMGLQTMLFFIVESYDHVRYHLNVLYCEYKRSFLKFVLVDRRMVM